MLQNILISLLKSIDIDTLRVFGQYGQSVLFGRTELEPLYRLAFFDERNWFAQVSELSQIPYYQFVLLREKHIQKLNFNEYFN
jgi:hypothetical protein